MLENDKDLPSEEENSFNTLGGFIMYMLGIFRGQPTFSKQQAIALKS